MKVSAIYPSVSARVSSSKKVNYAKTVERTGFTAISFKSGNPEQLGIWGAELPPYHKVGGVATVNEDFRAFRTPGDKEAFDKKSFDYFKQKNKYFANPLYNSSMEYTNGILTSLEVARIPSDLPEDSRFKPYAGKYFMTNNPKFRDYLNPKEFFEKEDVIITATGKPNLDLDKNIFILEDVTGGKRMMDFGDTGETEIKLFRTMRRNPATGNLEPINDFQVWVDLTATFKKPYDGGGYSSSKKPLGQTWKGDPYAKAAKAFVEFMPRISELTSIDPGTILCNDMQAAPVVNYMAEKAADNVEYYVGKKPHLITHNTQEAYIERTSYQNMFVNLADKELRTAVSEDPAYIDALKMGEEAVKNYFKALLPKELLDAQGETSQFMVGAYYAKQGFMPAMNGVSEKYIEKAATDPEFIPAVYSIIKELYESGKIYGINNGFENEGLNPYTVPGMMGYNKEAVLGQGTTINGVDGFQIRPMIPFNKELFNAENVDMRHFEEVKRANKINLMERFDPEVLKALEALKETEGHQYDYNIAITGLTDKEVKVHGYIDPKYVQAAKDGKQVRLLTSIGRGDKQKGFDINLLAFEKYIEEYGEQDPYTVLIMGGAIEKGNPEGDKIKAILKRMSENPKLQGRFAYSEGFSPNKPYFLAAEYSMLPSRFAPYELTDLESMKVGCTPIVSNGQGFAQKNFDSAYDGEAEKATSYKLVHEFEMSMDELREALDESDRNALNKQIEKFKKVIAEEFRLKNGGKELTEEEIAEKIRTNSAKNHEWKEMLRPYRDKVMVNDMVSALQRSLLVDCGTAEQSKRIQNQLKLQTALETNGALSKTKKSSAQLYREAMEKKPGEIKPEETLSSKLKKNCEKIVNDYAERSKPKESPAASTVEKSSGGAGTIIGVAVAAIVAGVALGYAIFNGSKNKESSKPQEEKSLSTVA